MEVCSNQLHLVKVEYGQCNKTLQKLVNSSAECTTKLNTLKTHKIPGLSFVTPRQSCQNVFETSYVIACELDCQSLSRKLNRCYSNIDLANSFLASCNSNITNLLTLLISSLITFCIFFMYLRRYRQCRSHRSSDVPMFDLAVNVAQPPPPAYQLPSIDYEDEISYIAHTGNVSGSAAATQPIIRGTSSQK